MRPSAALPLLLGAVLGAASVADALAFGRLRNKFRRPKTVSPNAPAAPNGVVYVDKDVQNIFDANGEWIRSKEAEDPEFFDTLGVVHKPPYMWIGCADARVPANEIIGEEAGQVFTVRNVANIVDNTDVNVMSALQYAVAYLKVQHIIVCGHYECGGVRASTQNADHAAPLENWLRNLRDVYRIHQDELNAISDPEQRHRRLVELNVQEQCINLFKTGAVQRRRAESKVDFDAGMQPFITPRIHGVVFDPTTGELKRVPMDLQDSIEDLSNIYDLYSS